jgi:hypothetical protein
MRNRGVGFSWYALVGVGAVAAVAGWVNLVAMASLTAAVLAATTYSVFSQRRMREVMPGAGYNIYLGLLGLAVACALLGTFAATKTVIADSDGRDHSLSYGIVCGIALIFGYRAVIKRTPRSVAVLALFTHVFGFIVVVYNFFGTQESTTEEFWSPMIVRATPAALAMYGLLVTTGIAAAVALLHFIPAREDDELADVPEAHLID